MEQYFELEDITLIPSELNEGHPGNKVTFEVVDDMDRGEYAVSLPIFTSPMESIIDKSVIQTYVGAGIRPVLPLTETVEDRLELCKWIFCSFTIGEVQKYFLNNKQMRNVNAQFRLCIDAGNGHDRNLLALCGNLKQIYGAQVILMVGNVGCYEVYTDYSRAGIDYMRVGISSGSLVDRETYGFHYPMGSLLEGLKTYKKTSGIGLPKQVKIVADGGIRCMSDIIKCLALGADYVMIGREFAKIIEAGGIIYKRGKTKSGDKQNDRIDPSLLRGYTGDRAKMDGLVRQYFGNTSVQMRAIRAGYPDVESYLADKPNIKVHDTSWNYVDIEYNMEEWITEFKRCAYYAFMMTGTNKWADFKTKIRYGTTI